MKNILHEILFYAKDFEGNWQQIIAKSSLVFLAPLIRKCHLANI